MDGRGRRRCACETKRPLRRIRIPRETALYGRDDGARAAARACTRRPRPGEGQVLLVEGEAGIGKTRLVDEFVGRLQQAGEDLHFLFGSYPPGGAATAAGAFSTAYREHFGEEELEETLAGVPRRHPAARAGVRGAASGRRGARPGAEPLTKDSLQTVFVHATRGAGRRAHDDRADRRPALRPRGGPCALHVAGDGRARTPDPADRHDAPGRRRRQWVAGVDAPGPRAPRRRWPAWGPRTSPPCSRTPSTPSASRASWACRSRGSPTAIPSSRSRSSGASGGAVHHPQAGRHLGHARR